METNTIIGIAIAIAVIVFALYILLRKPNEFVPSLDVALYVNPETNQPVLPRFVRQQLNIVDRAPEPTQSQPATPATEQDNLHDAQPEQTPAADENSASESASSSEQEKTAHNAAEQTADVKKEQAAKEPVKAQAEKTPVVYRLNPDLEKAEIKEFLEESSILDIHLHEQQRVDDECSLANAEHIIGLNVYPNTRRVLSGDKALKILLKYGLRFGELSCFHRYENTDEPSPLMFSVLRMTDEGPVGFDLESLSAEQVHGLAFFLALPHANAQQGFDMMVSVAGLIARDIDGQVFDENNNELTPQLKEHWRHQVIDFKSHRDAK